MQVDFPQKMAKRIRRKFRANLDIDTISTLANHFKQIYGYCSSILNNFISPVKGEYASLAHVKIDGYMTAIIAQYPDEDKTILKTIGDWAIYYEYLR